jgi:hypothetical protein
LPLVALGFLITLISCIFVGQRGTEGVPLDLTNDMKSYIKMAEGDYAGTNFPFKHRVLIPVIANLIPFEGKAVLAAINFLSLILLLPFTFKLIRSYVVNLEISFWGSLAAGLAHIRINEGPYLTDLPAILMTTIFLIFITKKDRDFKSRTAFIVAIFSIIMSMNRELSAAAFLSIKGFATRNIFFLGIVAIATVAIAIRILIPAGVSFNTAIEIRILSSPLWTHPVTTLLKIIDSLGYLWPWFLLGVFGILKTDVMFIRFLAISFGIASVSVCLANDTARVFALPLLPFAVVGSAIFFAKKEVKGHFSSYVSRLLRYLLPIAMSVSQVVSWNLQIGYLWIRIGALAAAFLLTAYLVLPKTVKSQ